MTTPHFDADTALELAHGLLAPAEAERLLAHARGCAVCEALLRETAGNRERFRARQAGVLATADATEPKVADRAAAEFPSRRPGRNRMAGAAVAAVVFAVTAIVLVRNFTPPPPPPSPSLLGLPDRPEIVHLRAPGEEADLPRLERAIARYEHANHARTAALLETPFATPRLEPLRRLYRTSALLALGRRDEAAAVLDSIPAAALPEPYADWRAWAELQLSSDPAAPARRDSLVRALAARPGPLQAKAQAALDATTAPR